MVGAWKPWSRRRLATLRVDAGRFVDQAVEHKLMLAHPVDSEQILVAERLLDIVGREGGHRADLCEAFASERQDVAQGFELHGKVAEGGRYRSEGVGRVFEVK